MNLKIRELQTMSQELSSKTILIQNHPNIKGAIKEYFLKTYALYEQLFSMLGKDEAYYMRAQTLRHPLIFYFGHTATVYVNKLLDYGMIKERVNSHYEMMFAVGVDEMDWDDLNECHYDWPSVAETKVYRDQVKRVILDVIESASTKEINNWHNDLWVLILGIEHERIHLETSAVIMRRVPLEFVRNVEEFVECPSRQESLSKIPINSMINIEPWAGKWERTIEGAKTYGWDNQFGEKQFDVKGFKASQMLVSNGQYLKFVEDGAYENMELWTEEGRRWMSSVKAKMPPFWRKYGEKYMLRTLSHEINMPWDWPAEINNLEARAYCKWRTAKTGKYTRLPTEDEYYSMRNLLKKDHTDWEYQEVGNVNMEYWMSPNPVDMFKTAELYDLVGNVWQHTITPIYPLKKFEIHPVYEDFTTPTFDDRHDCIKGGSFMSTGNEALYHARYAFRRHFYQFAGFRYIETDIEMEVDSHSEATISDSNVEMNLKHHYLNNESYISEVIEEIKKAIGTNSYKKALTVGCSVGRISLQLGNIFEESIGIDYTTRYFQMSTRLRQTGFLKFKDIDIDLKEMGINSENVQLLQMNPENPDENKISECDWIIIDGYALRKGAMKGVLTKSLKMAESNTIVAMVNVSGVNELSKEEAKQLMEMTTGGMVEVGDERRLAASERDQSYLPVKESQMDFRLNFYRIVK